MGTRKKKSNEEESVLYLKEETRHWIFAILTSLVGIFFILAAFGGAGLIGDMLKNTIGSLFGWGYYLFPIVLFIVSALFVKAMKPTFFATTIAGAVLLFISGLSLLSLVGKGGLIGSFISSMLIAILDKVAAILVLVALLGISILLTFDVAPSIERVKSILMFWKREPREDDEEYEDDEPYEDEEEVEEEEEEYTEEDDAEEEEREDDEEEAPRGLKKLLPFTGRSKKNDEVAVVGLVGEEEYTPPPLTLLKKDSGKPEVGDIKANANIIKRTLQNFGIDVEMDEVSVGPSVTRYALKPAQGVKLSRIVGLQNDLSLALAAHPLRIEAPIPGKALVGIEMPNSSRTTVGLASLLGEPEFEDPSKPLLLSLGRSVTGKPHFGNLAKMPHLLIAGTTGSGKSVAIHTLVASLLYRGAPQDLRFIMIDPKRVELTLYNKIPHLLTPVITDAKKAILALKWAAKEMDRRYDILEAESVRDIASYHKNIVAPAYAAIENNAEAEEEEEEEEDVSLPERMPYIVIIIDELADIMGTYPRELEAAIVRLAQMSRAVGIHLILSTQRPSVNVITGLIKANVPARIAFQVASQTDSRTIIDMGGAEKLLGAGDMLYTSGEMSKPIRLQSAFVSENEIKKIVTYIAKECGEPDFSIGVTDAEQGKNSLLEAMEQSDAASGDDEDDDLYEDAREIVVSSGKASTTFIQRKLRVGYARAARLMDMLEERGVVGPANGAKSREVYGGSDEGYGATNDGKEYDDEADEETKQ